MHQFNTFSIAAPFAARNRGLSEAVPRITARGLPKFYGAQAQSLSGGTARLQFQLDSSSVGNVLSSCSTSAPWSRQTDVEFADTLLREAGVASIPVSPFYAVPPRLTVLRFLLRQERLDPRWQRNACARCNDQGPACDPRVQADLLWHDPEGQSPKVLAAHGSRLRGKTDRDRLAGNVHDRFSRWLLRKLPNLSMARRWPGCVECAARTDTAVTGSLVVRDGVATSIGSSGCVPTALWSLRKRHLFRMAHEHEHYSAGSANGSWSLVTAGGCFRTCATTCASRCGCVIRSAATSDYELLFYVANWPDPRRYAWQHPVACTRDRESVLLRWGRSRRRRMAKALLTRVIARPSIISDRQ